MDRNSAGLIRMLLANGLDPRDILIEELEVSESGTITGWRMVRDANGAAIWHGVRPMRCRFTTGPEQ